MKGLFSSKLLGCLGLVSLVAAFAAIPAQAAVDTSSCETPEFAQPFRYVNDSNWYTLLPGENPGQFEGTGWQLSGGAKVVTTTLPDGSTSQVLDLPSGSQAVSPIICVTSEYPTARGVVRNVKGSEGIFYYVEYEGTNTWGHPKNTGQVHGSGSSWTAVTPVNMQPFNTAGWQPMRITLKPGGKTSDFQIYDLYVDPRMSR
jgi:Neuraminidase (sialidase)